MTRYLSLEQEDLFHQYSKIGKQFISIGTITNEKKIQDEIWNIITLDGILSINSNIKFLDLFISQIGVIYLISKYGKSTIKQKYLPRLMKGEMAGLIISERINQSHYHDLEFNKKKEKISSIKNNNIFINVRKIENDIVFYICEKNGAISAAINNSIIVSGNKLITKGVICFA